MESANRFTVTSIYSCSIGKFEKDWDLGIPQ